MEAARSVTFETKCWEGDWRVVLQDRHIESILVRHETAFVERRLLVNNVNDPSTVMTAAEGLFKNGLFTDIVYVPEVLGAVLMSFGLDETDLGRGLWYSSAELTGIRLCETDYLVHYASDAAIAHHSDWVTRGCELLAENADVACVNPVWNGQLLDVRRHELRRHGSYSVGRGFSDQCYLVRPTQWREADLSVLEPVSDNYPAYGQGLFERRADSWMRRQGLLRATDLTAAYIHPCIA